ncbi:hypothetical protein ACVWYH_001978 [Bradyrhizobium sp. GM24.11]
MRTLLPLILRLKAALETTTLSSRADANALYESSCADFLRFGRVEMKKSAK